MTLLSNPRPPVEFTWEEVNCFLRPQAMLCDGVAPGTGLLLLCLESLYQASGAGGFFGFPGLGHFAFADAVFTPLAGVGLDRTFVHERGAVLDALAESARGEPVLVPANCRHLPYFKGHGREDKLHFFIVTGADAAGDPFQVLDYLHVHEDNHSLEYAPTTLSREMMGRVTGDYWDRWVGVAPLTADMDERFWLLRVRATGRPPAEDGIPALILAECARLLDAPPTGHTLDERYLAELRTAQEAGDEERLSFLLENYLADANAALRYARIVEHALGAVNGTAPGLAPLVDEYRAKSTALRSKLMVRCMVAPSLPQAEWDAFRDDLGGLAAGLRREVRGAISPSF